MDMDSPAAEIQDFDTVVRLYWPRIFRFVLASLRDRDAAQTVTQDCFLKAYRSRDRFRGEASIHTWMIQIAVNLIRDFGRNRRLQFWRRARSSAVDVSTVGDWIPGREISAEARGRDQGTGRRNLAGHRAAVREAADRVPAAVCGGHGVARNCGSQPG